MYYADMDPEKEIFQKKKPDIAKLKKFGFRPEKGSLLYQTEIMDGTFTLSVQVKKSGVFCSLRDRQTQDEYMPIRLEGSRGAYVSEVRRQYTEVLEQIAAACFDAQLFFSPQANRLAAWIRETFGEEPDFPWRKEDDDGYATFRHPQSQKWYAVLMHGPAMRLTHDSRDVEEIDFINLKIRKEEGERLRKEKGIYASWHMNHKSWISVRLDETVADARLHELVQTSRLLTAGGGRRAGGRREWIIPSNLKVYDIISEYQSRSTTTWRQYKNMEAGDVIFIYVGVPYKAILYRCEIDAAHCPSTYAEEEMHMHITDRYDPTLFTRSGAMKAFGITNVRGPIYMPAAFSAYIAAKTKKKS